MRGAIRASFPPHSPAVKIQTGHIVQLQFALHNDAGEVLESSAEGGPMDYVHGVGELPPAIEKALDGQEVGHELRITLSAEEAYGEYDPEQIVNVARSEFPPDAKIVKGDWIEIQLEPEEGDEDMEDMEPREVKVVDLSPDTVSLDLNHPLAGQNITFELRVLAVHESADDLHP